MSLKMLHKTPPISIKCVSKIDMVNNFGIRNPFPKNVPFITFYVDTSH